MRYCVTPVQAVNNIGLQSNRDMASADQLISVVQVLPGISGCTSVSSKRTSLDHVTFCIQKADADYL